MEIVGHKFYANCTCTDCQDELHIRLFPTTKAPTKAEEAVDRAWEINR